MTKKLNVKEDAVDFDTAKKWCPKEKTFNT